MSEYAAIRVRDGVRASLQIPRPLQDIVIGYTASAAELLLYMPKVWPADYGDEFPYMLETDMIAYLYVEVVDMDRPSIAFVFGDYTIRRHIDDVYGALDAIFNWIEVHTYHPGYYIRGINAHIQFILDTCTKYLLA
jgi:hypothetical protein